MKRVSSISNNNRPVAGWKLQDENYLRKYLEARVIEGVSVDGLRTD